MAISQLAWQVLKDHASRSSELFYDADVLGSLFRESQLKLLDAAYDELVAAGYMEPAGAIIRFVGTPKGLHRLTLAGRKRAAEPFAA